MQARGAQQERRKGNLRGGRRVLAGETETSEDAPEESGLQLRLVKGDGRCLFRAIAVGLAHRRGVALRAQQEQARSFFSNTQRLHCGPQDAAS